MDYRLEDLIDMDHFQSLQDRLNEIYSFPSAIIDNDGRILTATAWQDVCTKFHRTNPECEKECIKSDQHIKSHLAEANPAVSYRCPHGLVDNAAPIIINGRHLGNFFTGQFFLQPPDMEFFRNQAAKFGFDEDAYLDAVRKVPIWTKEQVDSYLFFIKGLIEVIASIGLKNLKVMETGKNLEESEERHRTIVRTAMDGFWLIDPDGRILQVNEAYCTMSGYSLQELLKMNISDVMVAESAAASAAMQQIVTQGQARFETTHRRKDGTLYDLEVSAQYQQIGSGLILAFLRDITERKRTEKALRSREAFIRKILESVDEGFIVVDREYRVLSANRAFCRIAGLSETAVIGRPCHIVSHHSDRPCFNNGEDCPVKLTFDTGASHSATHTHRSSDGASQYLEIKSYPITDDRGSVVSVIETINDITEKKRLEDQLRQSQKMEAIGTLAGGVAHDFNNILTAIIGYGSILKMKMPLGDPQLEAVDEILAASERAARLTQSLLAFSRKQPINPKPVDLNDVVGNIWTLLKRVIGEDIELKVRLAEPSLMAMADAGQIGQVLMNLAANARDAMPRGGDFSITTGIQPDPEAGTERDCAVITVSDTGTGIDEQCREKIFEPFFTTKDAGKGTGLGLAMVYGIVKQHQGTITVDSEPGKGTAFRIHLPLITGSAVPAVPDTAALPNRGTETILLVEDEEHVRKLMQTTLEEFGYRVITAGDGLDALEKFKAHRDGIGLVILDVIMPRKSGKDVHDAIRSAGSQLPVLFISGYTADFMSRKGIIEDDVEVMAKPITPYTLLSKIRKLLDKKPQAKQPPRSAQ